jgi:hypothetical protein
VSDDKALIPIEQREVDFYDDELSAIRAEDGRIYASLAQMCAALGLDTQAQRRRIGRHVILSRGEGVAKMATPGGRQEAVVLRVDLVPLWLAGVRASAVRSEIREKLVRFQEEAAVVLWEAFQEGRLTAEPALGELLQSDTEAVQAYKMLQAMVKLARNQILLEAQVGVQATQLADHEQRLEEIESSLSDTGRNVTPEQASQLSQAVKAVALVLGKKTGRNEFAGVYGELYRKFGITSYKLLPARRFDEAMRFLSDWHHSITGDAPF